MYGRYHRCMDRHLLFLTGPVKCPPSTWRRTHIWSLKHCGVNKAKNALSKTLIRPPEICLDITKQNFSIMLEVFQNFLSLWLKLEGLSFCLRTLWELNLPFLFFQFNSVLFCKLCYSWNLYLSLNSIFFLPPFSQDEFLFPPPQSWNLLLMISIFPYQFLLHMIYFHKII